MFLSACGLALNLWIRKHSTSGHRMEQHVAATNTKEESKFYVSDHIYCTLEENSTKPDSPQADISLAAINTDDRLIKENQQLKAMLLLNLDLLQEQSEQVVTKNQEIAKLVRDNDMLRSKIGRMETRRKSKNKSLHESKSHKNQNFILVKKQSAEKPEVDNNRNEATELGRMGGEAAPSNTVQKLVLQRVKNTTNVAKTIKEEEPQPLPPPEVKKDVYAFDSNSNDEPQPHKATPSYQTTTKNYNINHWRDVIISENEKRENAALLAENNLEIPSWRTFELSPSSEVPTEETMSDSFFLKRHAKFEIDEKKRKKWDLMRIREEKNIERLKKRHGGENVESAASNGADNVSTFFPALTDVKFIHFCDDLPVQAFGESIPLLTMKEEFALPWMGKLNSGVESQNGTKYVCRKSQAMTVKRGKMWKK
jgi:male-specific lethal 1